MNFVNNSDSNTYWEGNPTPEFNKPDHQSLLMDIQEFIREKYIRKLYVDSNKKSPVDVYNEVNPLNSKEYENMDPK